MRGEFAALAGAGFVSGLVLGRKPIMRSLAADVDAERQDAARGVGSPAIVAAAVRDTNVRAMLAAIRWAEGTAGPDGYRMLFGGDLFDSWADHPRRVVAAFVRGKLLKSSAAGAYQILARTWDSVRTTLPLPDFSPLSQDLAAVELVRRRGALQDVLEGRFAVAVGNIRREWASLPGAGYGQPERKLADLVAVYRRAGGILT